MLVFCVRYVDLFMYFVSVYNTTMKILYIGLSGYIVYMIRNKEPWKVRTGPSDLGTACTSYDYDRDRVLAGDRR